MFYITIKPKNKNQLLFLVSDKIYGYMWTLEISEAQSFKNEDLAFKRLDKMKFGELGVVNFDQAKEIYENNKKINNENHKIFIKSNKNNS